MSEERIKIPFDEAMTMIPDGEHIHTIRSSSILQVGADWKRSQLIDAIKKYGVELSGSSAQKMGHGLVLNDDVGFLFIETKQGVEVK